MGLKVFAPASVANVAVGYDILGFAIDKPGDEIIVKRTDRTGLRISTITGDKGKLPKEVVKNTAGYAAHLFLDKMGMLDMGIDMEIHKKMPFGSGLGSSAASAVAGVYAVNELVGSPLTKRELLPFAVAGEEVADGSFHADNVAPSLMGGIILIRDNQSLDVHRLPTPTGLYAVVIYPEVEVLTKNARDILSDSVSLDKVISQTGNLGSLVHALHRSDLDLFSRSLNDNIIEPQRAQLIPHFYKVKEQALHKGALGFSISGAGPSMFAFCSSTNIAEEVGNGMKKVLYDNGIDSKLFISLINQEGAFKY